MFATGMRIVDNPSFQLVEALKNAGPLHNPKLKDPLCCQTQSACVSHEKTKPLADIP